MEKHLQILEKNIKAASEAPSGPPSNRYSVTSRLDKIVNGNHGMQTRSKTRARVEYARFERTVNLLLLVVVKEHFSDNASLSVHDHPEEFAYLADILDTKS